MVTHYNIMSNGNEVARLNSMEEATQAVEMFRMQTPHASFEIEIVEVSSVKPGFGRDPDLH
jgi:hypothetical protein